MPVTAPLVELLILSKTPCSVSDVAMVICLLLTVNVPETVRVRWLMLAGVVAVVFHV